MVKHGFATNQLMDNENPNVNGILQNANGTEHIWDSCGGA